MDNPSSHFRWSLIEQLELEIRTTLTQRSRCRRLELMVAARHIQALGWVEGGLATQENGGNR